MLSKNQRQNKNQTPSDKRTKHNQLRSD